MEVGTVNARLDAECLELRCDILCCKSAASCSRRAALEEIRREKAKVRVDLMRIDLFYLRADRHRDNRNE